MKCSPFSCFLSNTIKSKSNTTERADHNSIEKHMKLAARQDEKTIRVLLLGPGSSGKTTILKQIKKLHDHDANGELAERKAMAPFVRTAVIEYMKILCTQSVQLNMEHHEDTLVERHNECIRQDMVALQYPYQLTDDIASKITSLWADPGIQNTLAKRRHFQIHENASYFFERIDVVRMPSYIPSFDDYLRFRQRSTGFYENKIKINIATLGLYTFSFTDVGGQRSERRKWMHCVSEDVNAVLYVIAISDYDLNMFEDHTKNRLADSIELFENIMIKGHFFKNKSVILFFNKYDLFVEKIKEVPITVAFDDFPKEEMDPHNADHVVRFVAGKFMNVFVQAGVDLMAPLHIRKTTALDTNNIDKIFQDVQMDLVKEKLKCLNLM
eukprot:470962_1